MNEDKKCCNFFPCVYLESPNLTFWGMGSNCLLEGYCGYFLNSDDSKIAFY